MSVKKFSKSYPLSIGPMMGYTDRHFRYIMRGLTRYTLLYTEMIHANAICHARNKEELLGYAPNEKPLVLQLGGSQANPLAQSATIAAAMGYDGLNLNIGCPSPRASSGTFGACLMQHPEQVAKCYVAMQEASRLPVSVKHRLGIGRDYSYDTLSIFVRHLYNAGCRDFIVHARSAILEGLSPAQNRVIPPLCHDWVFQLAGDFPHANFTLNGGITSLREVQKLLGVPIQEAKTMPQSEARDSRNALAGVMIGRSAYQTPEIFSFADSIFYANSPSPMPPPTDYHGFLSYIAEYLEQYRQDRHAQVQIVRHSLAFLRSIFRGRSGIRQLRRCLGMGLSSPSNDIVSLFHKALSHIPNAA